MYKLSKELTELIIEYGSASNLPVFVKPLSLSPFLPREKFCSSPERCKGKVGVKQKDQPLLSQGQPHVATLTFS